MSLSDDLDNSIGECRKHPHHDILLSPHLLEPTSKRTAFPSSPHPENNLTEDQFLFLKTLVENLMQQVQHQAQTIQLLQEQDRHREQQLQLLQENLQSRLFATPIAPTILSQPSPISMAPGHVPEPPASSNPSVNNPFVNRKWRGYRRLHTINGLARSTSIVKAAGRGNKRTVRGGLR